MAMGRRKQREKQEDLWIAHTELASAPGHPFYQKLNELLDAEGFDEFVDPCRLMSTSLSRQLSINFFPINLYLCGNG